MVICLFLPQDALRLGASAAESDPASRLGLNRREAIARGPRQGITRRRAIESGPDPELSWARFWGQVRGLSGLLRALEGKGAASGETGQMQGKGSTKRVSQTR
jgi:hypothetical protein